MIATASDHASPPGLEINCSRQFTAWLAEQQLSLGFTTYQAGKLFLLGFKTRRLPLDL
ncbi:TIGR03032 family protein [Neosynechococcus sphagnicola]|uniref:TIGR03032 family protein n=1 Tax=Neosynechococcus sphagnicola TaxID=1501145 RepID=UPI000B1BA733|nr:TIGR03032 family protein [Neosynechococcus sphagnicola]